MSEPDISTLARRLAEQNNVDWRSLIGTGPGGKVVERDVLDYLARVMAGDEALDPTPEPLPEGMEAWPDQDAPSYFSAKPPVPAPAPAGEPQAAEPVLGLDDDAVGDDGDDDLLSDDIFLFDDGDETADDVVVAPFAEDAPQRFAEPSPTLEGVGDLDGSDVDVDGDDDALLVADDEDTFEVEADEPAAPEQAFSTPADEGERDGASLFDKPYVTFADELTTDDDEGPEGGPAVRGSGWGGDELRLGGDPFDAVDPDAEPLPDLWEGDEQEPEAREAPEETFDFDTLDAGALAHEADAAPEAPAPEAFTWGSSTGNDAGSGAEPDFEPPAGPGAVEPEPSAEPSFDAGPYDPQPSDAEPFLAESSDAGPVDAASDAPEPFGAAPGHADADTQVWGASSLADDVLDLEDAVAHDELDALREVATLDGADPEPAVGSPASLPLVRTGTVLRRHVDLSALAAAQLAAGLELGNGEPLSPEPFLLRAVAKAAAETDGLRGQVALADLRGEMLLRRVDDAARRPFAELIEELDEAGLEEDEVGLVAVDLSGFDVDEVLLDLDVPAITLGRIMYDTQRGAYRSTLALTGDLPLEKGAALLGRVAELLDAPVRLLL